MDQASAHMQTETEKPQNQKHHTDCPKHSPILCSCEHDLRVRLVNNRPGIVNETTNNSVQHSPREYCSGLLTCAFGPGATLTARAVRRPSSSELWRLSCGLPRDR